MSTFRTRIRPPRRCTLCPYTTLFRSTVILHTDHCAKKLLPWVDGLLDAGEKFYKEHGKPLFSSHMLDLSEEPLEDNISIRSEEHTSELQSRGQLVCCLLLEKK